jgi:hypothetical protein
LSTRGELLSWPVKLLRGDEELLIGGDEVLLGGVMEHVWPVLNLACYNVGVDHEQHARQRLIWTSWFMVPFLLACLYLMLVRGDYLAAGAVLAGGGLVGYAFEFFRFGPWKKPQ